MRDDRTKYEIENFFKKYFEREQELGAASELPQQFRTLGSGYHIFIDKFQAGYPRNISISKGTMLLRPSPRDLVAIIKENNPQDSTAEIIADKDDFRTYKSHMDIWAKNESDIEDIKLTYEFEPLNINEPKLEQHFNTIQSEAEKFLEFLHGFNSYLAACNYVVKVNDKPFMYFRRIPIESGVTLDVKAINFSGSNDEIISFAKSLDNIIEGTYSLVRRD